MGNIRPVFTARRDFAHRKLNEHLQRQKIIWVINERRKEEFYGVKQRCTIACLGEENSISFSTLWTKTLFIEICCRSRPWQPAPRAAWPPPAKFINVRNSSDLLGSCWELGQSSGVIFTVVHWREVILGRILSHMETNFSFLFVLGWTRQEGRGRW